MTKINDQVLAEVGIQLRNEKQIEVANLFETISVVLDGETYRRRLVIASDLAVPSGLVGNIKANYASPVDEGIEWFGMSVNSANVTFLAFIGATYTSPKGLVNVRYTSKRCVTLLSVNLIGAIAGPQSSSTNDYQAEKIYVPPARLLTIEFAPAAGNFNTEQINWAAVGWTTPAPRTKDQGVALKVDKLIVVP